MLIIEFILPWPLRLRVHVQRFEQPRRDLCVFGHVYKLDAPLDGVVKLVAVHAADVEEHPAQGVGDPRLGPFEAGDELAVAGAGRPCVGGVVAQPVFALAGHQGVETQVVAPEMI